MPQNIYALLVGINQYPAASDLDDLDGCLNDIAAAENYLRERVHEAQMHLTVLKDEAAKREAVIKGFREHLRQAGPDDVALFYYAGHGSQYDAPKKFWGIAEQDKLNETLVCYDSRSPDSWDLADKELAKLIAEVAQQNPHVLIILDCCHSGSGTRGDENPKQPRLRRVPKDQRERPLSSFIVSPEDFPKDQSAKRGIEVTPVPWLPQGRHVLLAACQDDELAGEIDGDDGKPHGAFSYFLMNTLQQAASALSYRDLHARANRLVNNFDKTQTPQFYAANTADLEQPFLGGAIAGRPSYFIVSFEAHANEWIVNAGTMLGLPQVVGEETTTLALFPLDADFTKLREVSNAQYQAKIVEVLPQRSRIEILTEAEVDQNLTFKAVVTSLPVPHVGVRFTGDENALQLVRESLAKAAPGNAPSLLVHEETNNPSTAKIYLQAENETYAIARAEDKNSATQIQGYNAANAKKTVQALEQIARWMNFSQLANPSPLRLSPHAIRLEMHRVTGIIQTRGPNSPVQMEQIWANDTDPQTKEVRLRYEQKAGKWQTPKLRVKLINQSREELYCALFALGQDYKITSLLSGGCMPLKAGQETIVPLTGEVAQEVWEKGVTESKDLLKLMVSTAEFDATLFEQEKVVTRGSKGTASKSARRSTLDRMLKRAITRDVSVRFEEDEVLDDWLTTQIGWTTVRPKEAAIVSSDVRRAVRTPRSA